jgi:DNA-binding MarR family transcriptional regulator
LSPEENLIYQRLHQAGNNGIWSQALQRTTNIPQTAFNRAIKSLETKKYIKRVRSVKVSRSSYYTDGGKQKLKAILMLYDLEPADDLTGGPWYTERDGLDSVFVEDLLQVVVHIVDKRSFPNAKKATKADGTETIINRFYQPSYRGYAAAHDIYDTIISLEVLQDDVKETFGISQVHQLLDVACIAKQIQKRTDGETYRSLLPDEEIVEPDELDVLYNYEGLAEDANSAMLQKGYTEAPCGRCPVFVECGAPGEEVSAVSCGYWDEWTGQIRPDDF